MASANALPCPVCRCTAEAGLAAHAVQAALRMDDLDRALDAGLLDCPPCPGCDDSCTASLLAARAQRVAALAARERHRARTERLQRRAAEREARRRAVPGTATADRRSALPPAAAAALARAKARAAGKG